MEKVTLAEIAGHQVVPLPIGVRFATSEVVVRKQGNGVLIEPVDTSNWPEGFFEAIHITDPSFQRYDQGPMPPVKEL